MCLSPITVIIQVQDRIISETQKLLNTSVIQFHAGMRRGTNAGRMFYMISAWNIDFIVSIVHISRKKNCAIEPNLIFLSDLNYPK